jgi:hypothetical protein
LRRAIALLVVLPLAGCGTSSDDEHARDAAVRFYSAVAAGDGTAACAELSTSTQRTIAPCARSVTGLASDLHGGRVTHTRVYITNALVEFSGGDKVFLGRQADGWKVDAAGCNFDQGKPADRPADCEIEG